MNRPAPSGLQMPAWSRHEDRDVELVLAAAWLELEHGFDAYSFAARVLGDLPSAGLERIVAELELAAAVEACTMRLEFEALTGVPSRSLSLVDDLEAHAATVRDDAVMQAEQLVGRARAGMAVAS